MISFITPLLNLALGLAITASAFLLDRTAISVLLVALLLGPLISLFSVMGIVYKDSRYGATFTGLLLVLQAVAMRSLVGSPSRAFDIVAGIAAAIISLVPHPQLANNDGERPPAAPAGH